MKRLNCRYFLMVLIIAALVFSSITAAFAEEGAAGLDNFSKQKTYNNQFTDVKSTDWFHENVKAVYQYGLMVGMSETKFSPKSNVTIAQAFTIAARLNQIYETGSENFSEGTPWYQVYLDYAAQKGILSDSRVSVAGTANNPATRAEFAAILANCLPKDVLDEINPVGSGNIPDVASNRMYSRDIYRLYRAGIIVGNDKKGTFAPDKNITRAEVAAIVTRMVDRSLRMKLDPNSPLITGEKEGEIKLDFQWENGEPCFKYYNGKGQLVQICNASGLTERKYNSNGLWIGSKKLFGGPLSEYSNESARVAYYADNDSYVESYTITVGEDLDVFDTYNSQGFLEKSEYRFGVNTSSVWEYRYGMDGLGRISQCSTRLTEGWDVSNSYINYTYNNGGQLIRSDLTGQYQYDAAGRLIKYTASVYDPEYEGTMITTETFEYDKRGNISYIEVSEDGYTLGGLYFVRSDSSDEKRITGINFWERDLYDDDCDDDYDEVFQYSYSI